MTQEWKEAKMVQKWREDNKAERFKYPSIYRVTSN
jgi:hypothetical protein